jgi:hypothetical protein
MDKNVIYKPLNYDLYLCRTVCVLSCSSLLTTVSTIGFTLTTEVPLEHIDSSRMWICFIDTPRCHGKV